MKNFQKILLFVAFMAIVYVTVKNGNIPLPQENTRMVIANSSNDTVEGYLTLSGYSGKEKNLYVQNVNKIFGITQTGLVGVFTIAPGDSVVYTSKKYFSGNIAFGSQPQNCKDSILPNGINIFEFNLNEPQESLDISCMAGVNCIMGVSLNGGPKWPVTGISDPRYLQNDTANNTNLVGVYPYGCTNCTNTEGKQTCQTPNDTPNTAAICNPTRAKNRKGGTVRLNFMGYTN